ncbi:MAG: hypothetical protein DI564_13120 [Rhodanobacter denitrificans]|uniref:Uncharacterized protein n=1 Tax=Rhodanobacter denitrificans TaxID=666685 RepID=A0A2W5K5J7_9GAMM|nr:MAG: hypothetical protein DI564_13120 [Rhodanobacter denitrificans]
MIALRAMRHVERAHAWARDAAAQERVRPTRLRSHTAAMFAIGLAAAVGAASTATTQPDASATGRAEMRSIELICGGGFSGASGGRRIDSAGRLWQVRQPLGAPRVEQPLGDDIEASRRWHALLDAAHFERLSHHQPGNLSCTLSRGGPEGTHRITWSGSAAPATLPAEVIRVVDALRAWAPPPDGDTALDAVPRSSEAAPTSNRPER